MLLAFVRPLGEEVSCTDGVKVTEDTSRPPSASQALTTVDLSIFLFLCLVRAESLRSSSAGSEKKDK